MLKRFLFALMLIALLPACGRKGPLIIPGTILPQAVKNLSTAQKEARILLAWDAPQENTEGRPLTDLAGFIVMRAEAPEGDGDCPCNFEKIAFIDLEMPKGAVIKDRRVVWADETSGLLLGRQYIYKAVPVNRDGFSGADSNEARARFLLPPQAPKNLAAKPGNRTVGLSWGKVEKDTGGNLISDFAGYNVYRSMKEGDWQKPPVNRETVKEESYADAGLDNNQKYFYRVTALRGQEAPYSESAFSEAVPAVPTDVEVPAPPSGLRAVPAEDAVLLSWDISPGPDIAGYMVYRQAEGEKESRPMTEKPVTTITFTDREIERGKAYTYYVTAVDSAAPANESGPSERVSVKMH